MGDHSKKLIPDQWKKAARLLADSIADGTVNADEGYDLILGMIDLCCTEAIAGMLQGVPESVREEFGKAIKEGMSQKDIDEVKEVVAAELRERSQEQH